MSERRSGQRRVRNDGWVARRNPPAVVPGTLRGDVSSDRRSGAATSEVAERDLHDAQEEYMRGAIEGVVAEGAEAVVGDARASEGSLVERLVAGYREFCRTNTIHGGATVHDDARFFLRAIADEIERSDEFKHVRGGVAAILRTEADRHE